MPANAPPVSASLTETLGAFVAQAVLADIPDAVLERAAVSLIHNLVIALAGRARETTCHVMAKKYWHAPAEASLLYDGAKVSVEGAAFTNAALMHARSQDDTHAGSTSHPGTPVIAAALAVAEAQCKTGADFLLAVILGYEMLARIGRDFDHLISKRGFRAAAVLGGFGAAAASTKLMNLDAAKTGNALALAAHFAGGLSQVWEEGSAEFPLQLAFPARNGIVAARAAQAGVTASRETLEGKGGFYRAYADTREPAREILAGLGTHWQLSEVTVKMYPVCAILQGPVGSMLATAQANGIDAEAVDRIELELSPYEAAYPGIDNAGPFVSTTATKMSAQFSLAASLQGRRLALSDLAKLSDPAINQLASRVKVVSVPDIEPRLSRLNVYLKNGSLLTDTVTSPAGQPTISGICDFAHSLSDEIGISADAMDGIIHEIKELRNARDLQPLLAALSRTQ